MTVLSIIQKGPDIFIKMVFYCLRIVYVLPQQHMSLDIFEPMKDFPPITRVNGYSVGKYPPKWKGTNRLVRYLLSRGNDSGGEILASALVRVAPRALSLYLHIDRFLRFYITDNVLGNDAVWPTGRV